MSQRYDWLVVGAGFTGAVIAERLANELDQTVLVIDRRCHVGGNAYDTRDKEGALIHLYGPHIFHTNSAKVFSYLSSFTEWRPYFHKVLGHVDGNFVPIPFNLNSIAAVFPPKMAEVLSEKLIKSFGFGTKIPIMKLKASAEKDLAFLSDYIFQKVFLNYTTKQWGCRPEDLDPSVTARVPVVVSRDDRYFTDRYQAMPKDGYTAMFERMLNHKNIRLELNADWNEFRADHSFDRMVYCGAVDEYFDCCNGRLPYRSLQFKFERQNVAHFQPCGTVNYPNEFEFTRITDFSYLSGETSDSTTVVKEYPCTYEPGKNEAYYPIPSPESKVRFSKYASRTAELRGKVWFAGRLADYQYYNMDQACGRALSLFEKELAPAARGMEME